MLVVGLRAAVLLLERSLRAGLLVPLLTTFGLAIVIQNVLLQVFSPDVHSLVSSTGTLATASWQIDGSCPSPGSASSILAIAVVVLGGLQLFLVPHQTRAGRCARRHEDPDTAELVGINARAVYARATAIAVAIGALGGHVPRHPLRPSTRSTGPTQLIFAFEAVVIGGFGSLWGTLLGGIVLGVAQAIGAQIDPQYSCSSGTSCFSPCSRRPAVGLALATGASAVIRTTRRSPRWWIPRAAVDARCSMRRRRRTAGW